MFTLHKDDTTYLKDQWAINICLCRYKVHCCSAWSKHWPVFQTRSCPLDDTETGIQGFQFRFSEGGANGPPPFRGGGTNSSKVGIICGGMAFKGGNDFLSTVSPPHMETLESKLRQSIYLTLCRPNFQKLY